MKTSIETLSASKTTHQNTHSALFEELAVVLPQHISHPLLRQMAERVQQAMFEESIADVVSQTSGDDDSAIYNDNDDHNNYESLSEIGQVKEILDHLLNTPNADAAVLVLITNEDQPKVLLTRRAAHLNSHAGEVSFAGGKHDVGDGNNVVTALREACEEVALPPSKAQIVGQLPPQTSKKGLAVRPIVALVEPPVTYVPELGEIDRIFWADFEKLLTAPTCDYVLPYKRSGQTVHIKTACWKVDGEVVWGLTGRILASLLQIGFDREVEWYYQQVNP
ncbi:CoA pyrophosphatase [Psychrobacter sp.]|uniref:NUDIX hydrolase n=1 Tax=Psychrobacter sp. TaxID=56811 RepID=UPI0025F7A3CF|nr:CoA pyrophosphatase [Psychrobacter sp.]